MSREELERIIPVRPPTVNRKIKPIAHNCDGSKFILFPNKVASHLNTLIPVGTAITIVVAVKYPRVSTSMPTVNMW